MIETQKDKSTILNDMLFNSKNMTNFEQESWLKQMQPIVEHFVSSRNQLGDIEKELNYPQTFKDNFNNVTGLFSILFTLMLSMILTIFLIPVESHIPVFDSPDIIGGILRLSSFLLTITASGFLIRYLKNKAGNFFLKMTSPNFKKLNIEKKQSIDNFEQARRELDAIFHAQRRVEVSEFFKAHIPAYSHEDCENYYNHYGQFLKAIKEDNVDYAAAFKAMTSLYTLMDKLHVVKPDEHTRLYDTIKALI